MKQWSVEWEQFCLWIVTEHGDDSESVKMLMAETSMDVQD
jgi:adenosine deaminase CECR1